MRHEDDRPRAFVPWESLHPLLGRLERWLAEHRPDFLAELEPGASDEELAALEREAGVSLPSLYAMLLRWRDGGSLDSLWGNFYLLSTRQVLDAMDLDPAEFDEPLWWHRGWIPFLDNGGGNYLCIDSAGCFGGQAGQLVEFWHDDDDRAVAFPSFEAWLSTLVEGLELGLFEDDGTEVDYDLVRRFERARNPGYPMEADVHWTPGAKVEVEPIDAIEAAELAARLEALKPSSR